MLLYKKLLLMTFGTTLVLSDSDSVLQVSFWTQRSKTLADLYNLSLSKKHFNIVNSDISMITRLIPIFWPFVNDSNESGWNRSAGDSASPSVVLLRRSHSAQYKMCLWLEYVYFFGAARIEAPLQLYSVFMLPKVFDLCCQESLFHVANIFVLCCKYICFMLLREFVLCCQSSLFYVAKGVCFILPREFVLCCQESLFYVAKSICFMLLREFVLCCQRSLFYVAKRVRFMLLIKFVLCCQRSLFYFAKRICFMLAR